MLVEGARSLRVTRLVARAPRVALLATCVVLATAGVRSIVAPKPPAPTAPTAATAATRDTESEALAEAFAHAYLTWGGGTTEERLPGFGADVEPPAVPSGVKQRVRWTTVTRVLRSGADTVVTVAAHTSRGVYHLSVPVTRGRRGLLAVARAPAIVGAVALGKPSRRRPEPDVDDAALQAMVRRAVRNYLGAQRDDLLADLTDDALVVLPDRPLRLGSVDAISWVVPHRQVAAVVHIKTAEDVEMTLRYELSVVLRASRWLVRAIHTNPVQERNP